MHATRSMPETKGEEAKMFLFHLQ